VKSEVITLHVSLVDVFWGRKDMVNPINRKNPYKAVNLAIAFLIFIGLGWGASTKTRLGYSSECIASLGFTPTFTPTPLPPTPTYTPTPIPPTPTPTPVPPTPTPLPPTPTHTPVPPTPFPTPTITPTPSPPLELPVTGAGWAGINTIVAILGVLLFLLGGYIGWLRLHSK